MPVNLVTAEDLARDLGVSGPAVAQAKRSGRLTIIQTPQGDRFDLAVARIQWEANRKRSRTTPTRGEAAAAPRGAPAAPPVGDDGAGEDASSDGGGYWGAKTRRELAEASMAELKERELRGELVRKALVERELAAGLVSLRESLEALADRLAAQVAAESDQGRCRALLREEHRLALASFTARIAAAEEVPDGVS